MMGHFVLPDWVFRIGWGTPGLYEYLQLRMEAAQLETSRAQVRNARKQLNASVANRKRSRDASDLRWAIKTSVPAGASGQGWGDLYFAQELASSLEKLGHTARVDMRSDVLNSQSADDDVVIVLRGVEQIRPQRGAINLLWVISHPSRISTHELKSFDAVFAASNNWSNKVSKKTGISIAPLLQATNPAKFNPTVSAPDSGHEVLFLGNTRNEFRKIIRDCLKAGVRPAIYGKNWDQFVSRELIAGEFIPNSEIAAQYRSAGVVLNDHWRDMANEGFYSNRLFDAVASGARVISDRVDGIEQIFDGGVMTYSSPSDLAKLCSDESRTLWGTQQEIVERATRIGQRHSFDQRAKELVQAVQNLI
jgi:O-antigen biosynthesis protein